MMKEGEQNSAKKLSLKIRKVGHLMRRQMDKSEAKQYLDSITGTHGYIVCYLDDNRDKDVFQKDIEKQFSIRRSTVTEILQRMEKSGLIQRLSVSSDARLKKIVLTEKAKNTIHYFYSDIEKANTQLVKGLSETEISTLISLLQKVENNLSDECQNKQNLKEDKHD